MKPINLDIDLKTIGDFVREHPDRVNVWHDKDGEEHKSFKLDVVPRKATEFKTNITGGVVYRTHFVKIAATKEERLNKVNLPFVGDGYTIEWDETARPQENAKVVGTDTDDIPF